MKYITELYRQIDSCEYGDMKEELLRDRLVVGILDHELSEKLQLEADLTLEAAKESIRQKEAVKKMLQANVAAEPTLDEVSKFGGKWKPQNKQGGATGKTTRCGKPSHNKGERCPATDVVCFTCKKRGHFEAHCFFRNKPRATANEVSLDGAFLDTVESSTAKCWITILLLENKTVSFKLDTGAEVTAVSEETFKMWPQMTLKHPDKKLFGPSHQALNVLGVFNGKLSNGTNSYHEDIYVIRGLKNNLLGLHAIAGLQLVQRLCSTETELDIMTKVFNGLGTFGEEYTIKLEEGASPHVLYTPRNVPLPLREKVKSELEEIEAIGVITKISEPTPWCAGMVVVPKKSGKVRFCVDLKPLNKSIMRETYPTPK